MSAEDQRATCENTARAMGDSALFIKQRHVRNCSYADPEYGKGVAKALGIDYEEALKAEDPAHPTWDPRNKKRFAADAPKGGSSISLRSLQNPG